MSVISACVPAENITVARRVPSASVVALERWTWMPSPESRSIVVTASSYGIITTSSTLA